MSPRASCISICREKGTTSVNQLAGSSPGLGRAGRRALPDQLKPAWQGLQIDTMAPTRPALRRTRRILLATGPKAAARARRHVRAALYAWDVPVEPTIAALLTSELVTNAIRYEAGETVMLVISCARGRFRVDVHDTSCFVPIPVNGPADAEAGRGLMLVSSLSSQWGFYPTPAGKAVYFTLVY